MLHFSGLKRWGNAVVMIDETNFIMNLTNLKMVFNCVKQEHSWCMTNSKEFLRRNILIPSYLVSLESTGYDLGLVGKVS